ncbi:hypothetical protein T484DRAFT_1770435, partial [Baffinella frigidus]
VPCQEVIRDWFYRDACDAVQVACQEVIRDWFYRDACDAVQVALQDPELIAKANGRFKIECVPPEINPEMDTFRVGTMLEMVRELALRIALVNNKRVKICIQGSLGEGIFTGLPLMLSGMRKVVEGMDWEAREGEMYAGLMVNDIINRRTGEVAIKGSKEGRVSFGEVGPNVVEDDDEVFIVIAPQSMVGASGYDVLAPVIGASVYDVLAPMVAKAGPTRPFILINPRLRDRPSSGGVMSFGGRAQRLEFAASFTQIYHFRLLYSGSTFMFPVQGALRYNLANAPYWTLFRRFQTDSDDDEREAYTPLAVYASEPDSPAMTGIIKSSKEKDVKSNTPP